MSKKRISAMILCLLFVFESICVYAKYEFPREFWPVNKKYEEALKEGNLTEIIEAGRQEIEIMKSEPDCPEKKNILASRYNEVGTAYAKLGDYDNSAEMFRELYDFAKNEDVYYDSAKVAKAKALQYASEIEMYTDGGNSLYYGAVDEKKNGVLFGMCAASETRTKLENESMLLLYQELGEEIPVYNEVILKEASEKGLLVEYALNCPRQGDDIRNIFNMEANLKQVSDMLRKYPDVPVLLRFAAEFDIWGTQVTPEEFVTAFRYVSQYFKSRNANVAIVWSPNQTSNWNVNIDDYYPGDEYVDWVGVSLYSMKYFLADPNQKEEYEIVFRTGVNSEPVHCLKELVEKYGDRKPIMLSESGCGHKLLNSGEDATEFALQRLREFYCYVPMIYPQVKLIAYFDWYVDGSGEKNDYRLTENSLLQNEYLKLTKGRRFIQYGYDHNTDFCYRPITDSSNLESVFEVSCYAYRYNTKATRVTYYIDDKYMGSSDTIPYTVTLDATQYPGTHNLKAVAEFENGKTLETTSIVNIGNPGDKITVEINNKKITFDRDPVLYHDRTMVPMRKIFEELSAEVYWDDENQIATGKRGNTTVKVAIGQNIMYVNEKPVELDISPFVLDGRTLVPARAIAEGLGCSVGWNGESNTVLINQ